MPRIALVILAFMIGTGASSQLIEWTPPKVTADLLTKAALARVPPDEVASGNAVDFANRLQDLAQTNAVRREDVALISIDIRGQWFLSAEAVAKEKAAALGANFLILESATGGEDYAGSSRVYRAVRLHRNDGLALYTRPREDVEGKAAGRTETAPAAFAPLKKPVFPPRPQSDLGWLWLDQRFILSHRLGVDLSGIADAAWLDLERTVRARFPAAEHERLVSCYRAGAKVTVDLKQKRLWPDC